MTPEVGTLPPGRVAWPNGDRDPVLVGDCGQRGSSPPRSRLESRIGLRMDQRMTALERAFQLARSGHVAGLTEIVTSLNREGYSGNQIEGRLLKRQLADLIKLLARPVSIRPRPKRETSITIRFTVGNLIV